jgi:hypothetical protein
MKLRSMIAFITIALIGGTVAPALALRPGVARADSGGHLQATFTKWAIGDIVPGDTTPDLTDMIGFVGGEVGKGTFFGEVFSFTPEGPITVIDAVYHVMGEKASFVAAVHVISNNATGIADITGTVQEINGAPAAGTVDGSFRTKTPCPVAPPAGWGLSPASTCFSGRLNVRY